MRQDIKLMYSFTDRNSKHHENGYKSKNKRSLIRLLRTLRKERGDNGDYNDIGVSEIADMSDLFDNDDFARFNGDITGWDTRKVEKMSCMFQRATSFNQPIGE